MRISTWNVTSLYRAGAMTLVARELAKHRLDLVRVQEVRLDGNGISPIGDYMLYYGEGNNVINQEQDSLYIRIKSAAKKVGFISYKFSYLILTVLWCDFIVINMYAPSEVKDDLIKDNFYEELKRTFNLFPRYHMKILLGDFNSKIGQDDIRDTRIEFWNFHK